MAGSINCCSRGEFEKDSTGTSPKTPEKTPLFESRAAECGAVAFDAANQPEIDPNLRVIIEAWPSLSAEIRAALLTMIHVCLERQSDASNRPDDDSGS